MNDKSISLLLTITMFVGILGDMGLQLLVSIGYGGSSGWGLKEYFKQHGSVESMTIAGGMMTLFYMIYIVILNLPVKWYYIAIYGVILDLIFRITMVFPSLKGYYENLNYFWSAVWGAIPMLLPFWLYSISGKEV
jgi:hypothetical protein